MKNSLSWEMFFPSLTSEQILQLERLVDLFRGWNQKLNLSSIRDREGVILKHVVDSLLVMKFDWIKPGNKVLDLGTGGGFPGLALAIAYPDTEFILVDATAKKIAAVQDMAEELGLDNVSQFAGRAEELGRAPAFRERFDIVVARALAKFPTLLEYCLPFVKVNGKLIAYQGPELAEEWKNYKKLSRELSSGIVDVQETVLPVENAKRCFVVLKKMRKISEKYPRSIGTPKKNPLA